MLRHQRVAHAQAAQLFPDGALTSGPRVTFRNCRGLAAARRAPLLRHADQPSLAPRRPNPSACRHDGAKASPARRMAHQVRAIGRPAPKRAPCHNGRASRSKAPAAQASPAAQRRKRGPRHRSGDDSGQVALKADLSSPPSGWGKQWPLPPPLQRPQPCGGENTKTHQRTIAARARAAAGRNRARTETGIAPKAPRPRAGAAAMTSARSGWRWICSA
jgi:hypothetical protein